MKTFEEIINSVESKIFVDGVNGKYVPKVFLERYEQLLETPEYVNVEEIIHDLKTKDISDDLYWEDWVWLTENCVVDINGQTYELHTNEHNDIIGYNKEDYDKLKEEEKDILFGLA